MRALLVGMERSGRCWWEWRGEGFVGGNGEVRALLVGMER